MIHAVTLAAEAPPLAPCPPFPDQESMVEWHLLQLQDCYNRGLRQISLSCRPVLLREPSPLRAAYLLLKAIMTFLYAHPNISRLTLLCGEERWLQAMTFQWNMWYAEKKPDHSH